MKTPTSTRFGLVLLLWAAGLGAAAQFAKVSVIFPDLRELYPDAGTEIGFLVSVISFMGIIFGTSAGMIVARVGFRRLILWALLLGAVVSAYQATLPTVVPMFASRVIEGLSHLVIVVAAPTLIAQISSDRHRPMTLTLWGTFFGVAFSLVAWFGLPLVEAYGLHSIFVAHAAFMFVVAVVLYFLLPSILEGDADRTLPGFMDVIRRHAVIYRSPHMSAAALGWLFYTFSFVSLLTLLPETVPPESRAFVAGAMPLASIISSMTLGIALLRVTSAVAVIQTGFLAAIAIGSALWLSPGSPWLCVLLFAALGLVQGASFAAVPQLNDTPDTQAMANGAIAQMGNLGNTCGTPFALAVLVSFGYGSMMMLIILCYLLGIAAHFVMQRRRLAH
ncbi:MFS transporter [Hoeflea prorocentri]|uniref:MFS transporter n=1 Tax=Hoeflea prorocentri TaxID=1922333 RepID=A0A9X3UHD1_9HYPH|nr:MFS transporter [Hoeflea prorocentri]MCY6380707.1 MFS transporter [Hoeflea prorocentri]MDA5398507.1 MFS transporter [Hoeflea prorocentri]